MNVLAFAATNSRQSINRQLVVHATEVLCQQVLPQARVQLLDLNDFELPLYGIDREQEQGIGQPAHDFLAAIARADALIVSFAEHNGSYSVAWKNLFDWMSRIQPKVFQDKPMLVMATSPGARGGASVLQAAVQSAPYFGGQVRASLSVPHFAQGFEPGVGLTRQEDIVGLRKALTDLVNLSEVSV